MLFSSTISGKRCCDVAIFAGSGKLPYLVLQELHRQGLSSLLFDLGCDDPRVPALASVREVITPIELTRALGLMRFYRVREVVMIGKVPHETLMNLRPWHLSWQVLKLWWSLADTRADTVLKALADYFTTRGFPVISSLKYLKHCLISKIKAPVTALKGIPSDAYLGVVVAKTLGSVDVGQSVVVHKGTVLAVEAMEGTDRCLDRAIELGCAGAILVKMSKPAQDDRFDVPTIGESTFQKLAKGQFRALVIEENSTLCTDPEGLANLSALGIELIVADEAFIQEAFSRYPPHRQS